MGFFDSLKEKAAETYNVTKEKASNLGDELKTKAIISDAKTKIEKAYTAIGKKAYEAMNEGKEVNKEMFLGEIEEIRVANEEIAKAEENLAALKAKPEVKPEPTNAASAENVEVNDVKPEENNEQ